MRTQPIFSRAVRYLFLSRVASAGGQSAVPCLYAPPSGSQTQKAPSRCRGPKQIFDGTVECELPSYVLSRPHHLSCGRCRTIHRASADIQNICHPYGGGRLPHELGTHFHCDSTLDFLRYRASRSFYYCKFYSLGTGQYRCHRRSSDVRLEYFSL